MFTWKRHKDIFKGEGIYHLTFVVLNRKPILGTLQMEGGEAQMIPSALGRAISRDLSALHHRRPYCRLLAKQLMPDHIHVLIWITADCGVSVKEIARGMLQGWRKLAALESGTLATHGAVDINRQMPSAEIYKQPPLFSVPFLRTLSRKGQLNRMIAYIHDNPRRAMLLRLNPDLFRLRREVQAEGLTFTALGNLFLLDYPQRQSVECSRSAAAERIAAQQEAVMQAATEGAVTFSGAVSAGEKQIVRAVREAGLPVVVLLNDGFPPAGSEHEKYYRPGGVYFEACAAGRLLLLEATEATLCDPRVATLTDRTLRQKAEARHQDNVPLPHTSLRWRMMANNTLVGILTGERQ